MNNSETITFLVIGLLAALGYVGDQMFRRTRIPDVLLLMVVGVLIGPAFSYRYVPDPSSAAMVQFTGYFGVLAMIFIIFDGGLELDFDVMLSQAGVALGLLVLSLVGCMAGLACAFHYVLYWPWIPSLTLAAILGNISGAIVLPVVQGMTLPETDKTLLKLEAAGSDVLVIIFLITLVNIAGETYGPHASGSAEISYQRIFRDLLSQFSVALLLGGMVGMVWIKVLNHVYGTAHYYIFTLGALLTLYSITQFAGASGPMAVLAFGVILSNARKFSYFFNLNMPVFTTYELKHLHSTFSFFVRTFFLIYVGLFLNEKILDVDILIRGFIILVIIIFTRFFATQIFSLIFKKSKQSRRSYFFMLPRGLAVAVLATLPMTDIQKRWNDYLSNPENALSLPVQHAIWEVMLEAPPNLQQNVWKAIKYMPGQERQEVLQQIADPPLGEETKAEIWTALAERADQKTQPTPDTASTADKRVENEMSSPDEAPKEERVLSPEPAAAVPLASMTSDGLIEELEKLRRYLVVTKTGDQIVSQFPLYAAFVLLATNLFLSIGVFYLERSADSDESHPSDESHIPEGGPPELLYIPEAASILDSPLTQLDRSRAISQKGTSSTS